MAIEHGFSAPPERGRPLRATIAECLALVIHGGMSLDRALQQCRAVLPDPREQGFLQETAYGVLRQLFRLRARLATLLERPLRKRESVLECLLLAGLYQLREMAAPAHAVVNESVAACLTGESQSKSLPSSVMLPAHEDAAR